MEFITSSGVRSSGKCKGCVQGDWCQLTARMVEGCKGPFNYPEQEVSSRGVGFGSDESGDFVTSSMSMCGSKWLNMKCESDGNHSYYMELLCGKEYCSTCGVKGSKVHKKRIKAAMDRLGLYDRFAEMVITVPKEYAMMFLDRGKLDSLYKASIRVAKMVGKGGFARVHFFGDKKETMYELHPHINLLIADAGYLKRDELESVKESLGRSFRAIIGHDVEVNLWYRYYRREDEVWRDSQGKKCKGNILRHKVKYITRPTIGYERLNGLDFETRASLIELLEGEKGEHKRLQLMRWFGNLSNSVYKKTLRDEFGSGLFDGEGEKMVCPCCSSKMSFKLVDSFLVPRKEDMDEVSPGLYKVKSVSERVGEDFKSKVDDYGKSKIFGGGGV